MEWVVMGVVVLAAIVWIGNKLLDGAAFIHNERSKSQARLRASRPMTFVVSRATQAEVIQQVQKRAASVESVATEKTSNGLRFTGGLAGKGVSFVFGDGTSESPMSFTSELIAEQSGDDVTGRYQVVDFHEVAPPVELMDLLQTQVRGALRTSFPRIAFNDNSRA